MRRTYDRVAVQRLTTEWSWNHRTRKEPGDAAYTHFFALIVITSLGLSSCAETATGPVNQGIAHYPIIEGQRMDYRLYSLGGDQYIHFTYGGDSVYQGRRDTKILGGEFAERIDGLVGVYNDTVYRQSFFESREHARTDTMPRAWG